MRVLVQKLVTKIIFFTIIIFGYNMLRGQYCVLLLNKDNKNIEFNFLTIDKNSVNLFRLKICDSVLLKKRKDEIRTDSLVVANSKQNEKITVRNSYTDACSEFMLKQINHIPKDKKYFIYSLDNFWSYYSKHVNETFYFVIIENNKIKYYEGKMLLPRMT